MYPAHATIAAIATMTNKIIQKVRQPLPVGVGFGAAYPGAAGERPAATPAEAPFDTGAGDAEAFGIATRADWRTPCAGAR